MKAVTCDRYGPPEVLQLREVERPVPKDDEVLVRVYASTATRTDSGLRSAEYFISRAFTGIFRPKAARRIIGTEFAGVVESVGSGVTEFEPGDHVFGIRSGSNAEYVCVREDGVVEHMPAGLGFAEAAAVADGALSAMSCLRQARVDSGKRVVIFGASGSIGVGAVQVAKQLGAHVTAVCNTKNLDLMRSLGADEVVDYVNEDFTKSGETYDVIFDAAGKTTFLHCRRSLTPEGVYITTDPGFMWQDLPFALLSKRAKIGFVRYTKPDIVKLKDLLEAGEYRAVIDRMYPIGDVADAHRYVDTHQKTGNVVLTIRDEGDGRGAL